MTDKTTDKFGPDDIPRSRILETEWYMIHNAKEIVDHVEKQTVEDYHPRYEPFDKLLDKLINEMPFGPEDGRPYIEKTHVVLANALMSSLWCGWLSQAMVNREAPKFKEGYVEQFERLITKAFDIGRNYASQRP